MGGENSREIDQAAAQWAARLDRAPLSPLDEAALEAWLQDDPRRLGAYAKARAISVHSQRAVALAGGELGSSRAELAPQIERRALLAASVAVGLVGGSGLFAACWRRAQSFRTEKGEVRTIALGDGSFMTLNTGSRASVRYGREMREIVLTFGEALFSVAEGHRPFVVQTAGTTISAVAGKFVVRRIDHLPLQVLALDTAVRLHSRQAGSWQIHPRKLAAVKAQGVQQKPVDAAAIDRALAWRDMRIALQNEPLKKAVAEFARFSDTRIELANETVGALRITGLFKADDPAGFARAVAVSLNLQATMGAHHIRLDQKTI